MGLLKLLGLNTKHEGQHQGGERGKHATTSKPGKHKQSGKGGKGKDSGKG